MMERWKRIGPGPAAVVVLAVTLTACGEGGILGMNGDDDDVVEIRLTSNLTFSPAEPVIEPGTTVRWVNDADIFHTITPDGHSEWSRQTMSTAGETFEHTFEAEGTFPYFCEPHESQGMEGTITVRTSGPSY